MKIPFLRRYQAKNEKKYIEIVLGSSLEGDGYFTDIVKQQIRQLTKSEHVVPLSSCTHALELAVRLCGIQEGDEVIIPSFTFPSTGNAVLLSGGVPVYGKVNSKTLNLDISCLESLITKKTKAIIPVHYGGASCGMDEINYISKKYNLKVIEDAAQGIDSFYNGKHLGTIGDMGCISFHGTKNITAGEGGVLILKDTDMLIKAETFKDKGTNRKQFIDNKINRYEWIDIGSSYSPSELTMAVLSAQLEEHETIKNKRMSIYNNYKHSLANAVNNNIEIPDYNKKIDHNGHIYFLNFNSVEKAKNYYFYMRGNGIDVRTHFEPLHKSIKGQQYFKKNSDFKLEDELGSKIIRLPIYPDLLESEQTYIIEQTLEWLKWT